ncbi:hypothetical protein [Vibrio cholerae]|uniref:hypothetical protein n=1 Tax=Vibrio cholerae TaxID=666 RepID=UPI001158DAAD|nr:hypothetical protein [Vibrio cholerae]TQO76120.1 hypothetical protein FLM10_18140 [Vibrio cholerae]
MRSAEWLKQHIENTQELSQEALDAVSDFTLMWALFEASEGQQMGNMLGQLSPFAERVSHVIPDDLLVSQIEYWSQRYARLIEGTNQYEPTERFHELGFNEDWHSELVFSVLIGNAQSRKDIVEACLLIVYRYRNRLFHGMKDITRLNGQVDNLNHASTTLQLLMPFGGRALYLGVPREETVA